MPPGNSDTPTQPAPGIDILFLPTATRSAYAASQGQKSIARIAQSIRTARQTHAPLVGDTVPGAINIYNLSPTDFAANVTPEQLAALQVVNAQSKIALQLLGDTVAFADAEKPVIKAAIMALLGNLSAGQSIIDSINAL